MRTSWPMALAACAAFGMLGALPVAAQTGIGSVSIAVNEVDGSLATSVRRLGVASMRERAESIGGHLSVESTPGSGTRVSAELPLPDGD